jgi:Zn-dependent peptidase ImmA (M78 family)
MCNHRGIYVDSQQTVYICDTGTTTEKEYTKLHEIGHYVWFRQLTDKQRADYKKLYQRALKQ